MRDFTRLQVWQKSHALTVDVYQVTHSFPSDERYGLTQQLRRAAASIPANIAEGAGRRTKSDFARFIDIASGSANEALYHMMLSRDLLLLSESTYESLAIRAVEVRRMLTSLAQTLRSRSSEQELKTED